MLVYEYPIYFSVDDDEVKQIIQGHTLIISIDAQIEQAENKLKEDRKQQEDNLIQEKKSFQMELENIQQQLDEFKNKNSSKEAEINKIQIKKLISELQEGE